MKNKVITFLIIAILIAIIPSVIFAYGGINTEDISINVDIAKGSSSITGRIVGTLQVAGTVISVISLIIIGIRYMVSSVEEKAQLKGILMYWVIGAILVFTTSNLLSVIYDIITGF